MDCCRRGGGWVFVAEFVVQILFFVYCKLTFRLTQINQGLKKIVIFITFLISFQFSFGQEKGLKKIAILPFLSERVNNKIPDTVRDAELLAPSPNDTTLYFKREKNGKYALRASSINLKSGIVFQNCNMEYFGAALPTLIFCDTIYS